MTPRQLEDRQRAGGIGFVLDNGTTPDNKLTGESGRAQYNHVTTAVGYASASDKQVHFGLGADRAAAEIEIRWPSGAKQVLRNVPADQVLKVREP